MTCLRPCGKVRDAETPIIIRTESENMKRIKTLETRNLCESAKHGGCGECQTSCQSACKTSCGVANQKCERPAR